MIIKGLSMYFQPIVWFIPSNRTDIRNAIIEQFGVCYIADIELFTKYYAEHTQEPKYNAKGVCTNLEYTDAQVVTIDLEINEDKKDYTNGIRCNLHHNIDNIHDLHNN